MAINKTTLQNKETFNSGYFYCEVSMAVPFTLQTSQTSNKRRCLNS